MGVVAVLLIAAGVLFVVAVLSGVWLSRMGRPLNGLIFTLHKLIALGSVVLTALAFYPLVRAFSMGALQAGAIVLSGALFILLFATGALLSSTKPANALLLTLHKIGPVLAVICAGGAIYLIGGM